MERSVSPLTLPAGIHVGSRRSAGGLRAAADPARKIRSARSAAIAAVLATFLVAPGTSGAQGWAVQDNKPGGFRIEMPGKPLLETFRIEEVEGIGGSGTVGASSGKESFCISYAALANPSHPKAEALVIALGEKFLDFWSKKLPASWAKTGDVTQGGLTGIELNGKTKNPAQVAKARVLRADGRRYILFAVASPEGVRRFFDSLELTPVVPPAPDAGNGKQPVVAEWRKVTLQEAACEVDLPGPANFKNANRIEQSDGGGWMGAQGFHRSGKSGGGTFLVLYGRTTQTKASPKELRRLVAVVGEKTSTLLRTELLKTADEKWSGPVAGSSATDTAYFTRSAAMDARLRKIVYGDRVYFLIGIGAPGDVSRFLDSVKPLQADAAKPR